MANFGNDITITSGGGTFNIIHPLISNANAYRIIGSATLASNVVIQPDPTTYSAPEKWDTIVFMYDATLALGTSTLTVFGSVISIEQALLKGMIVCQYDGSDWIVKLFLSDSIKPRGIGSASRVTLTASPSTVTLTPDSTDNVLTIVGSPTLAASFSVTRTGSYKRGDMQVVYYKATATTGTNTVTLFSKQLTTQEALDGNSILISTYDGTDWQDILLSSGEVYWESGSGSHSLQRKGESNNASGAYSLADGVLCTASGLRSSARGHSTTASGIASDASGDNTQATGDYSKASGKFSIASGDYSEAGGLSTTAKADYSRAFGKESVSYIPYSEAHSGGKFSVVGDSQTVYCDLKKTTTGLGAAYLLLDDASQIAIPTDCTMEVFVRVTAVQIAGTSGTVGDSFSQIIKACVKNIAGTSSVVGTTAAETAIKDAAFGGTIALSVSANTLRIQCTPEADKTVLWRARVELNMIGYNNFDITV